VKRALPEEAPARERKWAVKDGGGRVMIRSRRKGWGPRGESRGEGVGGGGEVKARGKTTTALPLSAFDTDT